MLLFFQQSNLTKCLFTPWHFCDIVTIVVTFKSCLGCFLRFPVSFDDADLVITVLWCHFRNIRNYQTEKSASKQLRYIPLSIIKIIFIRWAQSSRREGSWNRSMRESELIELLQLLKRDGSRWKIWLNRDKQDSGGRRNAQLGFKSAKVSNKIMSKILWMCGATTNKMRGSQEKCRLLSQLRKKSSLFMLNHITRRRSICTRNKKKKSMRKWMKRTDLLISSLESSQHWGKCRFMKI